MLYTLLKPPVKSLFAFFYRRVFTIHAENIPNGKPTIVVANHSNTFIDPVLIAAMQHRPLCFWARSNEFKNPFLAWFMRNVHVLPIYRQHDGRELMANNDRTFEASKAKLLNGNMLFIAPEGNCFLEKRLRPLKQGAARVALEFLERYPDEEIYILPTGLNFENPRFGGGNAYVSFGKAIAVKPYAAIAMHDAVEARQRLTDAIFEAMRRELIHITPEDEPLVEPFLQMQRNDIILSALPSFRNDDALFEAERALAMRFEEMDSSEKDIARADLESYQRMLTVHNIDDLGVAQWQRENTGEQILVALWSPLAALGYLSAAIPNALARAGVRRLVKDETFEAAVGMVLGMVCWILFSAVITLTLALAGAGWASLLYPIASFTAYYSYWIWIEPARRVQAIRRYRAWRKQNSASASQVEKCRSALQLYAHAPAPVLD